MGVLSRWIGRDDGFAALLGEPVAQLAGVIGAIGDQLAWGRNAREQRCQPNQVMDLPRGQGEGDGPAESIGQGMNFSRPSAARPADGVLEVPPFAPAAERCALTWVESTAVVLITPLEPLRA